MIALDVLSWLDTQQPVMEQRLWDWAEINTGTDNAAGLAELRSKLQSELLSVADGVEVVVVEPHPVLDAGGHVKMVQGSPVLRAWKRRQAKRRVLLAIHMDTVYGPDSSFQHVQRVDASRWQGPGVADAKGGLVVLLFALKALERHVAETGDCGLGWEVLINADEEIGSPGSGPMFEAVAPQVDFALLFEPCMPDGRIVSSRKGSGNFSMVVRGKSAHSGRDFHAGRNAVVTAAQLTLQLHELNQESAGTTINVSRIDGGGPANIVPDLAIVRWNVRYEHAHDELPLLQRFEQLVTSVNSLEGFHAQLHGGFTAPPKILGPEIQQMLELLRDCGRELGLETGWQPSGGVCDGNRLASWGVPNIDTMGVRGGAIHSSSEYVILSSLSERAKLTTLMLLRLANAPN